MMQLYNGDCLEVMQDMPDNSVDYVLTSPPYNSGKTRTNKSNLKGKYEYFADNNTNYLDWCIKVINELLRITNNYIFWNIQANYYNKKDVYKLIGFYADQIEQNIIWNKPNGTPSSYQHRLSNVYEYILVLSNKKSVVCNPHHLTNVITLPIQSKKNKIHNAVMPQNLSDFIIKNFTKEKEIILDPFMGIGTTGISCVLMNREFIGIELDRDYFDISENRIQEASKS